ncbi:MAG: xanthine dehydrogenase family protein molybdopterin-binding subunit [Gammaproteobacteria bacterium]|nr:xanthine dehydrogenase family protein molybdopterin-binding subunit [Gammaproteobacteria bacterium]
MTFMHIGKDFIPPDVEGKVTGDAKYVEDFAPEGMVYARLLTSPVASGRVVGIDASEALRMDGVLGVLTADDLPPSSAPDDPVLASDDVTYIGQPIAAIAAISDSIAENAIDRIKIEFERRNFVTDPLESLIEGGPNAYPDGNVLMQTNSLEDENATIRGGISTIKWPASEIENFRNGKEPRNVNFADGWTYGDLDSAFAESEVIVEESFVTAGTPHHCLEPRSSMAYWQNGKCYFYASTQSQSAVVEPLAALLGIEPENVCMISENTGGGFGSKGRVYPTMAITGRFAQLLNRPVQLRITREEEYYLGVGRPGMQGWVKAGIRADGTVAAVDVIIISDGGPTGRNSASSSAQHISVVYTPTAMRLRNIPVFTNTAPRGAQRGPGQNEMSAAIAPIMDKAARDLGMDRAQFRRVNAPHSDSPVYESQGPVTSAFMAEAIDIAMEMFNWTERETAPRQRNGSKVRGLGIGLGYHSAGGNGYDGLVRITPDGRVHLHSGVGNLGTYSYAGTARAAAEVLKCRWESCEIVRGSTDQHLPHSSTQGGSNTIFTHTRTNWVAAEDAVIKLKEIAATEFGGNVDQYDINNERVFKISNPEESLSYAEAAAKAIEVGGKYSGQEYPNDLHPITQRAVEGIAGTGLIGVARDNLPKRGIAPGLMISMTEIEIDLETGKYEVLDYVGIADCGTIIHPQGLSQQINGGAVWGFGMAASERHVYDPQNALPANIGLYQAKLPTIMDVPIEMTNGAVDIADPYNPAGGRGVGEPSQGSAVAAVTSAIADALGHSFNRVPVTPDMIVNFANKEEQESTLLAINTF